MLAFLQLMLRHFLSLFGLSKRIALVHHAKPAKLVRLEPDGTKVVTGLEEVLAGCRSLSGSSAWFTPTAWLASGHLSTIYCTFPSAFKYQLPHALYSRTLLRLPDGGTISLDQTPSALSPRSKLLSPTTPFLVTLHGLTGGSHESYCFDVLGKITKAKEDGGLGWRGVVINFRGCAGTEVTGLEGQNKRLYHGGATKDLECALLYISHAFPDALLYATGFSLGANVLAKHLGEAGPATPIKGAVILSPPWNFYEGHKFLSSSVLQLVYSRAMAKNLRTLVARHYDDFKEDPRLDWDAINNNPSQTLYEFDGLVTRVLGGFTSTEHYYRTVSADQYAPNVSVPLLSISALDDPIVSSATIPLHAALTNPFLMFATTKHGGHLGWFEGFFSPRRWIGKPVYEFFRELEKAGDALPRVAVSSEPAGPGLAKGEGLVDRGDVVVGRKVRMVGSEDVGFELVSRDVEEDEAEKQNITEGVIRGL